MSSSAASSELELVKFRLEQMKFEPNTHDKRYGPVIVLIGKRDTGKSVILRAILHRIRDIPLGVVMSGTEHVNQFFADFVPSMLIQSEYSENHINKINDRQIVRLQTRLRQLAEDGRSDLDTRIFIVLDDCMYDDKWTRTKLIRQIFCNGRHWNTMLIITLQYPVGIPPILRENIDYTFILRQVSNRNRKIIYENYASIFPTYDMFCQVMDRVTDNYHCMVIDNSVQSNRLQDVVYWYKAPLTFPPFRMCADEYWAASESMKRSMNDPPAFTPDMIRKKTAMNVKVSMV